MRALRAETRQSRSLRGLPAVDLKRTAALDAHGADPVRSNLSRRERAISLLREAFARVTEGRIAVIDLLLVRQCALSAAEILNGLGPKAPDRVTVYRTLAALADCGILQEELSFDKTRRYAVGSVTAQARIRFRCLGCGLEMSRLAALSVPDGFAGCAVTTQTLMLEGRCSECR